MKKIHEGASIVSALLLILTAAAAFIFNVQNQNTKSRTKRKEERKTEKILKEYELRHRAYEKELEEENEELHKERDPLWHYYDREGTLHTKPGNYWEDEPPPNPREDYY